MIPAQYRAHAVPLLLAGACLAACSQAPPAEPRATATAVSGTDAGPIAPSEPPQAPHDPVLHWQCGETMVASRVDGDTVRLFVTGRLLTLEREAPVAPGTTRAADGEGNRFESAGDTARFVLSGDPPKPCTKADRPSPWFEAAMRGVVLRGIGNEPGWLVEIRPGPPPSLHAVLDYGERTLDLAPAVPGSPPGLAWSATSPKGLPIRLEATPGTCRDAMSGVRHEARVDLSVGDRAYAGCGARLDDFQGFMD